MGSEAGKRSRGRAAAFGLWALLLVPACAQQRAAVKPSERPAPAKAPATEGSREPAAGTAVEPGPERDGWAARAEPPAPAPARIEDFMSTHFLIVTWARDAVINGSLEALREPLTALADFDYGSVAPGGWMEPIAALQTTARITAESESLDAAAAGVAVMARQCGDCHTAERHKPYFGPDIHARQPLEPGSLRERMERHIWATDRMWEGLTAPSEDAWNAGAAALANVPVENIAAQVPVKFVPALRRLRELGTAALSADTRDARTKSYGTLLASCAACHAHADEFSF